MGKGAGKGKGEDSAAPDGEFAADPAWPKILAGVLGSWVGTRLRPYVPQLNFQRIFRWMLTLLALRMIAMPLFLPH